MAIASPIWTRSLSSCKEIISNCVSEKIW